MSHAMGYIITQTDLTLLRQMEQRLSQTERLGVIGQLTAGTAHDFNNLLAAISLNLELILDEDDTPAYQRQRATVALNACASGRNISQQLLALAKRPKRNDQTSDLTTLIESSTALIRNSLPRRIEVSLDLPSAGSLRVIVDQGQFDTAMLNLAFNARDSMVDGGTLTIRTSIGKHRLRSGRNDDASEQDCAVISVSDTGTGMPEEIRQRALDPFFTTKDCEKGTGLGLSMVHDFVTRCGGVVDIRSEFGIGTTVSMILPLALAPAEKAEAHENRMKSTVAGQRALLVEDNDQVREALHLRLEGLGFSVRCASNAEAALELLQSGEAFDLLMTDLDLPGSMDGNTLATISGEVLPDIKIVTITGNNEGALRTASESQTSARRRHLQKPFTAEGMLACLRELRVTGIVSSDPQVQ